MSGGLRRRAAAVVGAVGCAAVLSLVLHQDQATAAESRIIPVESGVGSDWGLRLRNVVELSVAGVGGLSGLWVSPDRRDFVAVSDDGDLVRGRFVHDDGGRLSGIMDVRREPLSPPEQVRGGKRDTDCEELARTPDGGWLASFERRHRILKFGPRFQDDGPPQAIPAPPGLENAPDNGGVESLAVWGDGAIMALLEGETDWADSPGWSTERFPARREDWRPFVYKHAPGFRPSGAAALPDGGALVLERRATLLGGFSVRLVRLGGADIAAAAASGGELSGFELARFETPFPADNYEGVAVVPSKDGALQVYVVSDDNRSPLQRTLFLHLTLPPDGKP